MIEILSFQKELFFNVQVYFIVIPFVCAFLYVCITLPKIVLELLIFLRDSSSLPGITLANINIKCF